MCITLRNVAAAAVSLLLLFAGSAQAAGPYEPNDAPDSAFGPIGTAGGLHVIEAAGETAEDEDWYALFVPEGEQDVVVTLEQLEPGDAVCMRLHADLDGTLSELASVRADVADPQAGVLSYTVSGPARAFVSVDGCSGFLASPAPYRLTLQGDWPATDPGPADGSADPADPPAPLVMAGADAPTRCHAATAALRAARYRYRVALNAHRSHRSRASRRRLAAARRVNVRAVRKVVRIC